MVSFLVARLIGASSALIAGTTLAQAYQDQDTDYMDSRRNSASTTDRQQSLEVPVTPAAAPMRKDVQQQKSQQQRPVEAHQELQHLWHHNPMIETDLVDFWDCVVPGSGF